MASQDLFVGLDLGSTKTATIIAEVDDSGKGNVVGIGSGPSEGMKRGVVIDIEKTIESIERSVEEAERMAGVQVNSVYAGIAGDHIRSINSSGIIAIARSSSRDRTGVVTKNDVDRVIEAAKAINLPMDREVLHILPQDFAVDGQKGVKNPIGMMGVRLEAEVHIITGAVTSAQNIYRCVKQAGISVRDLVLEPLASSYAVLTNAEKELGVGLLDLGGGTTDLMIFHEGGIRFTSVIGVGGEMVTKDIGIVLRIPFEEAEQLKLLHGHCFLPLLDGDEKIVLTGLGGRTKREISRTLLTEIIQTRMAEIFANAAKQIESARMWDALRGGLVLTGGMARMDGVAELAEDIFDLPIKVGYPTGLGGLMESARNPTFATAIGLALYGISRGDLPGPLRGDDSTIFQKIFGRMRGWFEDFF